MAPYACGLFHHEMHSTIETSPQFTCILMLSSLQCTTTLGNLYRSVYCSYANFVKFAKPLASQNTALLKSLL